MAELDLEAIKRREQAATEGPWEVETDWDYDERRDCAYEVIKEIKPVIDYIELAPDNDGANAEFIAHARTDIPALVDEVERLRGPLERTTGELESQADHLRSQGLECETRRYRYEYLRGLIGPARAALKGKGE